MSAPTNNKILKITEILKEAWHIIPGLKWPAFKRFCLFFAILMPIIIIQSVIIGAMALFLPGYSKWLGTLICAPITFFLSWMNVRMLAAPVIMMGVRQAIGLPVNLEKISAECKNAKTSLFQLTALYTGFILIITVASLFIEQGTTSGMIVQFILSLAVISFMLPLNAFAMPLMITRKLDINAAIDSALRKMKIYWKEVLVINSIFFVILIINHLISIALIAHKISYSVFIVYTLLILISSPWLMALFATINGVLFRNVYGLKQTR